MKKKKLWLPIAEPTLRLVKGRIAAGGAGVPTPGGGGSRPHPTPIGPQPGPVPHPTTRGDDLPYTETWWSPTKVIKAAATYSGGGALSDEFSRSVLEQAPRLCQTVQFWGMVPTGWSTSQLLSYVWEPTSSGSNFYIQYDSAGASAGLWRIARDITIAAGAKDFTYLCTANTWYHFTVVFENNALKFYVNGVLQGSDVTRRWFASFSEGNVVVGNTASAVIGQGNWGGSATPFSFMAVTRWFAHAMDQTEVTATWRKVLYPGYRGMVSQVVGLDEIDHPAASYLDSTCWTCHSQWKVEGDAALAQTPSASFPAIIRQVGSGVEAGAVAQEQYTVDIDVNTWPTGAISVLPSPLKKYLATTAENLGTVVDPGGGQPKYWQINNTAGGTLKNIIAYIDPAETGIRLWNTPHVIKGGFSLICLQKNFYRSDTRSTLMIGSPRAYAYKGLYGLYTRDLSYLYATATTGDLAESLASATPGTGVTQNWYFHELQVVPTTYFSDGQWIGTVRARWWAEATGINNPPGSWNMSVDITANATHKRYPIGGTGYGFIDAGKHFYDGVSLVVKPHFNLMFGTYTNYNAYVKFIRARTFAYTP